MSQNFKTAILNHNRWVYRAVGQTHTSSTQVRKRKLVWACRIRGMAGEKQNHLESNWNIDEVGWDIGSQVFHSFPLSRLLHSTYPVVYVSRRIGIRLNLCRGEGQGNTLLYKNAASSFCRPFQGHYSDSNTQGLRLSSLYSRHIFFSQAKQSTIALPSFASPQLRSAYALPRPSSNITNNLKPLVCRFHLL